ncbi:MAG: ribosome small subunit-dependent GTPase A [Tissierellia bacterium]|nr:ribosome small subunit-dependent GTPase A [Tissierellia bacterium]
MSWQYGDGRIINSIGGFYEVQLPTLRVSCRARGVFREQGIKPLPGDIVHIRYNTLDNTGYIEEVKVRKNTLLRPPVANLDQAAVVVSTKSPKFNGWGLDRMLIILEHLDIPTVIVVTKDDLDPKKAAEIKKIYSSIGYEVYTTRATIISPEELSEVFAGKITALMGPSGVGKTSLINAISPLELSTGTVSTKTSRGKHTTRHVELYPLGNEGYVFDTPGFSSLDLTEVFSDEVEIKDGFPEFRKLQHKCKFLGCVHDKEPECAIKEALGKGEVHSDRYENYLMFLEEIRSHRRY